MVTKKQNKILKFFKRIRVWAYCVGMAILGKKIIPSFIDSDGICSGDGVETTEPT
jgi:hypothetical protein